MEIDRGIRVPDLAVLVQIKNADVGHFGGMQALVEIAGQPDADTNRLEALLSVKAQQPFEQAKVNQSIAALKNSGAAKEVELELRPQPDGVRVVLVLQPAIYFGIYTFSGTGRFGYSRLLQVADYPPRGVYSAIDVTNTTNLLQHFFQQNGFFKAEVHPVLDNDTVHKLVNVNFQVTLGRHAKFGKLFFDGAPPKLQTKLQHDLTSWRARLREAAVRKGKNYSWRALQKVRQTRILSPRGSRLNSSQASFVEFLHGAPQNPQPHHGVGRRSS